MKSHSPSIAVSSGGLRACVAMLLLVTAGCTALAQQRLLPRSNGSAVEHAVLESRSGCAVYYSRSLHGSRTADGGRLDNAKLTAAHTTYPFGTIVRVTREKNGRSVEVRVTDHLPRTKTNRRLGIIIDLTRAAASELDMIKDGRVKVKVEVLHWGTKKQR